MNNSPPTFGQKIRQLRDKKDLSLRELASKVSVSAAFLSDVELGRRFPGEETLRLLAKVLEADLEELRKYDFRDDSENIKKMMFADASTGLAFRRVAESIRSGTSPEEIIERIRKPQ